jgi:Uma2 family endonuclease
MALPRSPYCTPDEYLAAERESPVRHEYLAGRIYAMAGESLQHSQIGVNLIREVSQQLKGRECQALSPNMKVKTGDAGLFSYPDLTVVCGKPLFLDTNTDVLLNPTAIFEVLSPSTEAYDRGEKLFRYRNFIETLMDYVLVSQRRALVERYSRQPNGQWLYVSVDGLSSRIQIESIGCTLELSEIYARVEFPEIPEPDLNIR